MFVEPEENLTLEELEALDTLEASAKASVRPRRECSTAAADARARDELELEQALADAEAEEGERRRSWELAQQVEALEAQNEELELECAEGMGEESPHSGLTDTLLIELGKNCPNLKSLALQGHLDFSDKGLDALLAGCRELEKLKLHIHTIFHAQLSRIRLSPMCVDAIRARGFRMACLAPYYLESSSAVVSWKVSAAEARTQDNAYPYA
jgi:hypothetical protein